MNDALVIDAGLAFRPVLPGPTQGCLQALTAGWRRQGMELVAPALWAYETTSAPSKVVQFGALVPDEGRRALALANGWRCGW